MGQLDEYGKNLVRVAAGGFFTDSGPTVCFEFGPGAGNARIDRTIAGQVAVEIESRVPKQIRGALVDLVLHPYPKKLLVLLPAYIGNPLTAENQARAILSRFLEPGTYRIVCATNDLDESIRLIRNAVIELGVEL